MRRISLLLLVLLTFQNADAQRASGRSKSGALYPPEQDNTPPTITIIEPSVKRGMKITLNNKSIVVKGKVSDDSGVYEVLVNGLEAHLMRNNQFWVEILLGVGENKIQVKASDTKGNVSEETFTIVRQAQSIPPEIVSPPEPLPTGEYFALLIAVQQYPDPSINDLDGPIQDAIGIKNVLTQYYTFPNDHVVALEDPSRSTIIKTFEELGRKVTSKDRLLIFYAGHGYWDEAFKQGYWLPTNAVQDDRTEWISNGTIRDFVRGINSKHTLLIADACFSGAIFKTRSAFNIAPPSVQELDRLPSRKAMTSGTLNEVPDKSVFVQYFIKRLTENRDNFLPSQQLFSRLRQAVINNSPIKQVPQFGEIRETGDEGGDFIFVRRK